ncbi:hypothetical protein CLU79DRAFT_754457 [Phycomyces nitens]|nr:hypothetical protein CLU79DRAFT_754457 [Phycomyces nitens]
MTVSPLALDITDIIRVLEIQIPKIQHDTMTASNREHRAQMQDSRDEFRALGIELDYLRKTMVIMKEEISNSRKVQERLESQLYAQEQETAHAHKEMQTMTRLKKEAEKRLESELRNHENDRSLWQQRETELRGEIKRWAIQKQSPRRTRSATASNIWDAPETVKNWGTCAGMSPIFEDRRALTTDTVSCRDAKIRAQEKVILDIKTELQQQKRLAHEAIMTTKAQAHRVQWLEEELGGIKRLNASLMEDNEGYQLLLHERTMTGIFKGVEPEEPSQTANPTSLAAELQLVVSQDTDANQAQVKKLTEEVKTLQEANKALTLYMNKILLKIVDNNQLVDVLNIDDSPTEPEEPVMPEPVVAAPVVPITNRPRRSTISSWMSSPKPEVPPATVNPATNNDNGWTRALRRMTVMSWTQSSKSESPKEDEAICLGHDSAISSRASESAEEGEEIL